MHHSWERSLAVFNLPTTREFRRHNYGDTPGSIITELLKTSNLSRGSVEDVQPLSRLRYPDKTTIKQACINANVIDSWLFLHNTVKEYAVERPVLAWFVWAVFYPTQNSYVELNIAFQKFSTLAYVYNTCEIFCKPRRKFCDFLWRLTKKRKYLKI